MAQVIKLQCPNCGAPLVAYPKAAQVTCEYCKHVALLYRPDQAAPPEPSPLHHSVRIDVPKASAVVWPMTLGFVATMGMIGAVFYFVSREVGSTIEAVVPNAKDLMAGLNQVKDQAKGAQGQGGKAERYSFADQPQLADLNGDGTPEIIGLSGVPGGESWIAAYDGRTLQPIWKTPPLSKDAADSYSRRAVVPGLVLVSDSLGKLQAYSDKTGQPAWAALVGERVEAYCLGDGFVRVLASDYKEHDFLLDSGKRREDAAPAPKKQGRRARSFAGATDCVPILGNRSDHGPEYSMIGWSEYRDYGLPGLHSIEGISAHRALVIRGTKRAFMFGGKSEGTSYPMVAAVDGQKVLWKDAVSGSDPMASSSNPTTQLAAYAQERLAVPYEVRDGGGTRIALFDTTSGKRLWDMPVHKKSHVESGMAMTKDTIYYGTWTGLYLIDVATGKTRGFLGYEF